MKQKYLGRIANTDFYLVKGKKIGYPRKLERPSIVESQIKFIEPKILRKKSNGPTK